jgi:DNA-binding response OmpR family regulator
MLPKIDGFHVCRYLQGSGIPIIMLTAKSDISDKLMGLETGADDYIVKPFDNRELVARVCTIFRRLTKLAGKTASVETEDRQRCGIEINEETRRAYIDRDELNLTPTEFGLLLLFANNPGKVFTRAQLLDSIWGYDFLGDSRTVDIHIQRLRKKLGIYSSRIETVFGVGYRFMEPKT